MYDFWEYEKPNYNIKNDEELIKLKAIINKISRGYTKLLIFAGSGMSQESNLPIYNEGLMKDYKNNQSQIIQLFEDNYPHEGYNILLDICKNVFNNNYYILTTNIDGYFKRSGFDENKIIEIHGNIFYSQCKNGCNEIITPFTKNIRGLCNVCQNEMIPNVYTGRFINWIYKTRDIESKLDNEISTYNTSNKYIIIEIGAGVNLPVIRDYSEILVEDKGFSLIRINPDYPHIDVCNQTQKENFCCSLSKSAIQSLKIIKDCINN